MTTIRCTYIANILAVVFTIAAALGSGIAVFADTPEAPGNSGQYSSDEKAVRLQADQFVKAFQAGDAKAIAALWAPDANLTTAEGVQVEGRDKIQKLYADYFSQHGGQAMQVNIKSIRFPAPDVAIEQGTAKVAGDGDMQTKYTVVHIKKDGQWLMSDVTETACLASSSPDYLNELNWLIGDWTAESEKEKVHLKAHWVANKHFILCGFRQEGQEDNLTDAQIIGWDPEKQHIFSSIYSLEGGFGRAVWSRDGQNWVLRAWSVQPDGSRATAQYIFHPLDANAFTWRSCNRTMDGKPLPDTREIRVVRDIASK